jgi:GNAT superfamily N-acetyltransferase
VRAVTVIVRGLRPDDRSDTEGFTRVRDLVLPFVLTTPDAVRHTLTHSPPAARFRVLLAEEDGEITGTAYVGLIHESPEPGRGFLNVHVRPDRRGRGAGTLLARAGDEHLAAVGARKVFSWVLDEPGSRGFAERRGLRAGRSAHFQRPDLVNGPLRPLREPPPGVELRTAADFADDPRPLFELDAMTAADEPSDVEYAFDDYEAWLEETWRHPLQAHDLTVVAVVDGRPASYSVAYTDGKGRYATAMTGTARDRRGRGLAKLAKNASLHRARAAGCREAFTSNDTGNEPMLAINRWFGYEICATEVGHVRELG